MLLAAVCVGVIVRTDKEYRRVRTIRQSADSILSDWILKKCVPRATGANERRVSAVQGDIRRGISV